MAHIHSNTFSPQLIMWTPSVSDIDAFSTFTLVGFTDFDYHLSNKNDNDNKNRKKKNFPMFSSGKHIYIFSCIAFI